MDDSANKAAIEAIFAKKDALLGERASIREQRAALSARDREIDRELADCRAAARLFGAKLDLPPDDDGVLTINPSSTRYLHIPSFQASEAAQRSLEFPKRSAAALDAQKAALAAIQEALNIRDEEVRATMPRVRDIVLDRLQEAGAEGSKAAPIQAYIESTYATKIHDKTVGMTLYRLMKEGLVRRDGHTWFIAPEAVNPGAATPGSDQSE
jgi:hypothetical protein